MSQEHSLSKYRYLDP